MERNKIKSKSKTFRQKAKDLLKKNNSVSYNVSETVSNKSKDLNDYAPIGYFKINQEGYIQEISLTGESMINKQHAHLIKRMLAVFALNETRPVIKLFREKIFSSKALEYCEVVLIRFRDSTKSS